MMSADVISVEVLMTFRKRGGRKVIIAPDGTLGNPMLRASIDNNIIKAVARAFRWQRLLENGTYSCADEIAKAERIDASFISRIIRLTQLAPDIVDMILEGRQPADMTLKKLMAPFPVEWDKQRVLFVNTDVLPVAFPVASQIGE